MPVFAFPFGGEPASFTWPAYAGRVPLAGDIALVDGQPVVVGNDLLLDDGLKTAVQLSLFCDARAGEGDVLPSADPYRRGWWADQFEPDRVSFGSRLWLLERAKLTRAVLDAARSYALEALQWLLDDAVAESVDVVTEWYSGVSDAGQHTDNGIAFSITITRPGDVAASRFGYVWQGV